MEEEILKKLDVIEHNTLLASKNVLGICDVSALTGISKSTLYKMTCQRRIPHYKPTAKLLYFDRGEVEAWMKQNRVNTIDEAETTASAYMVRKGAL